MHCVFGYVISGKQFVAYEKLLTVKQAVKSTFTKNYSTGLVQRLLVLAQKQTSQRNRQYCIRKKTWKSYISHFFIT